MLFANLLFATAVTSQPLPTPIVTPSDVLDGEKPVAVEKTDTVVSSNGLFKVIASSIVFSNPNDRQLSADFEFPLPDGATVCGYKLEVNGEMIPGVVCEKERARVAFENEQRRQVDPGIVEHVKGNVWRTRIFPLPAKGKRRAEVSYIVEEDGDDGVSVAERCGGYVYEGRRSAVEKTEVAVAAEPARNAWVLWDASLSRKGKVAADIEKLRGLKFEGEVKLVVFRNVPSEARSFKTLEELANAVEAEPCDGGTDIATLLDAVPCDDSPKYLFSDEVDTLGNDRVELDSRGDFVFASRPAPRQRKVSVTRRKFDGARDASVAEGRLLATAWSANRIADLSFQADSRKEEFMDLGREFGIASPVTSLIVLETLDQWLEHGIEPPKELSFHDEWVRRRAAQDDQISREEEKAEFAKRLLGLWKERVEWWNDPKPKKRTPKSGLFDGLLSISAAPRGANMALSGERAFADDEAESVTMVGEGAMRGVKRTARSADGDEGSFANVGATVKLAAWNPDMPYLKALDGVAKDAAYGEYIAQAAKFGESPAFYIDCAGWFFKAGMRDIGVRIISNLAEFKLEDVALWRIMGWRLREAGEYAEAIRAFRHALALRGEEGQSYRDLALVLVERGKDAMDAASLTEGMALLHEAAFENHARRSARRSNDMQVAIVALEELNEAIWWSESQKWEGAAPVVPELGAAYRRDLPMDLRIIMSWDVDETDIDIHVLEPNDEEAYYGNRRTTEGGFVGEDVTTGFGPEEYLRKDARKGVYKVLSNYFASHQQSLTGAATVTATVYTNWGRKGEKRSTLTLRLDKPKDKHMIGEVTIE